MNIPRHKQRKREQTRQAIKKKSGVRIQALRQFLCLCYGVQECNSPRISFASNKKLVREDKLYQQAGQFFLVLHQLAQRRGPCCSPPGSGWPPDSLNGHVSLSFLNLSYRWRRHPPDGWFKILYHVGCLYAVGCRVSLGGGGTESQTSGEPPLQPSDQRLFSGPSQTGNSAENIGDIFFQTWSLC